jgi:hypothetical protein
MDKLLLLPEAWPGPIEQRKTYTRLGCLDLIPDRSCAVVRLLKQNPQGHGAGIAAATVLLSGRSIHVYVHNARCCGELASTEPVGTSEINRSRQSEIARYQPEGIDADGNGTIRRRRNVCVSLMADVRLAMYNRPLIATAYSRVLTWRGENDESNDDDGDQRTV